MNPDDIVTLAMQVLRARQMQRAAQATANQQGSPYARADATATGGTLPPVAPPASVLTPVDSAAEDAWVQQQSGGKVTLADIQRLLESASTLSLRNLARSFGEGATLNSLDEGIGAVAGPQAAAESRFRANVFGLEHPLADMAAQTVGSAIPATAATLALPAIEVAGPLGTALRAAGIGSTLGAAAGAAGAAPGSRLQGATGGAILGGVTGALTPVPEMTVRGLTAPSRAMTRLRYAANVGEGGLPAVQDQMAQATLAGRGPLTMVGDLSPMLQMELDFAANNSAKARSAITSTLNNRFQDAGLRLQQDLLRLRRDATAPNAELRQQALRQALTRWGNQYYGAIPDIPADMPALTAAMQSPAAQMAWRTLNIAQKGRDSKFPLMTQLMQLAPAALDPEYAAFATKLRALNPAITDAEIGAGWRALGHTGAAADAAAIPSMRDLNIQRKLLGNEADANFRSQSDKSEAGAAYATFSKTLNQYLREHWPGFATVNDQYGVHRRRLTALAEGAADAFDADPATMQAKLAQMEPGSQHEYRTGVASAIWDALTNRPGVRAITEAAGSSQNRALQQRLSIAFDSPQAFQQFMNAARIERTLAESGKSLVNSTTHFRDAMAQGAGMDMGDVALTTALYPNSGMGSIAKRGLVKRAFQHAITRNTADEVAALATQTGPDAQAFLDKLALKRKPYSAISTKFSPALLSQMITTGALRSLNPLTGILP